MPTTYKMLLQQYYWHFTIALIAAISLLLVKLYFTVRKITILHRVPGPPRNNFFIGNGDEIRLVKSSAELLKLLHNYALSYQPLFKLWITCLIDIVVVSPEDIEVILRSVSHKDKSNVYESFRNWLGSGLLTSGGAKWVARRKLLQPTFHAQLLQHFVNTFHEEAANLLQQLPQNETDNTVVDVRPLMKLFTLSTITRTMMGSDIDVNSAECSAYKKAISTMDNVLMWRTLRPWMNYFPWLYRFTCKYLMEERPALKLLHSFTMNIIRKRIASCNHSAMNLSRRKPALLDQLLIALNAGHIDLAGVREEVDTFTFAGHETTATALSFALMLIATHPTVQLRLYQEITANVQNPLTPTIEELTQGSSALMYMDLVVKEVLRLYPSVHYISRQIGADVRTPSGYLLPKGTYVHCSIFTMHRNPKVFPDPDRFDPDRFLPENCATRHSFAYLPFSAGPRNCIGQKFALFEIKALLSAILFRYRLEPVDTSETIVLLPNITLQTRDSIHVKFVLR